MPQANYFDQFDTAPQAAPQSAPTYPGVIMGRPDPAKAASEVRAQNAEGRAVEDQALQRDKFGVEKTNSRFNQASKLRDDYNQDQSVKNYASALPILAGALQSGDNGAGDLSLVYAYAKMMDPTTGVREGEMANVGQSSAWADSTIARLKGQLDASGGRFSQDTRRKLQQELIKKAHTFREAYNLQRQRYIADAQSSGIDPQRVVGPDVADPFRDDMANYDKEHKLGRFADPQNPFAGLPGKDNSGGGPEPVDGEPVGLVGEVHDEAPWKGQPGSPGATDGEGSQKGARRAALEQKLLDEGFSPSSIGAYIDRLYYGATMGGGDEIDGILGGIGNLFSDKGVASGYRDARDESRVRQDMENNAQGVLGKVTEFGGSLLLPLKGIGKAGSLSGGVKTGAAYGAASGWLNGEGAGNSALSGIGGSAIGGALGGAAAKAVPYLAKGASALSGKLPGRASNVFDREVVAAGERQGINIRQPDARADLGGRYASAESGEYSGPMIRAARDADNAAIGSRVEKIGGTGTAQDNYALGGQVQEAGKKYIASTRAQADRLYKKVEKLAGGKTVIAKNADAALDANIQELKAAGENSNAAAIKYLEGVRSDIDRGLTVDSVQNLRTNMRGQLSERGLTGTDTDRRIGQVIDAMNSDLAEQLPKGAAQALKAADSFYRGRQEFINGTLKEFMGSRGNPLPAEDAAKRLISMTKGGGNFDRFSRMWGLLDDAQRADAQATIAASLGRRQNGDFSAAELVKSLDPSKGMNPRTVEMVFGKDGAKALQDLRVISKAKVEAMNRMSPSGKAVASTAGGLKTALLTAVGFYTGGVGGAAAGAVARPLFAKWGEERAARMLLNPDFTRWLRAAPQSSNPQVIDRYFAKLTAIPSIAANDNQVFMDALKTVFAKSTTAAAARDDEQKAGHKPPQ